MENPGGWGGPPQTLWNGNSGGVGGSTTDPLEWKFQGGGGVKTEWPSVGGVWIFSGNTQWLIHCVRLSVCLLLNGISKLIQPLE